MRNYSVTHIDNCQECWILAPQEVLITQQSLIAVGLTQPVTGYFPLVIYWTNLWNGFLSNCFTMLNLIPHGVLEHAALKVTVCVFFPRFAEAFPVHVCAPEKERGRRMKGQVKRRWWGVGKCHRNIVHLLSAGHTQTSEWSEGLIGWLADWASEWMNGWLANWLTSLVTFHPSIHPSASLSLSSSLPLSPSACPSLCVCVSLLVRPISSLGSVCDWNKN